MDIHRIMRGLAARRPIFHSEADFQFALAWQIKDQMPACEIRLEFPPFPRENMALDIWIPTMKIAIELKYTTGGIDLLSDNERFALKNHAALPLRRYDFINDIQRLERVEGVYRARGIAVMLTNTRAYWSSPSPGWGTTTDTSFRIHEGRTITGVLGCSDNAGSGTTRNRQEPIRLERSYPLRWRDYSALSGTGRGSRFRYLAVEVGQSP